MTRVAVLGAGSWGTALANHLVKKGCDVLLWAYEPEVAESVNREHQNRLFAPGVALDPALRATNDAGGAVRDREVIISASPSQLVRTVLTPLERSVGKAAIIVGASKGIELDSLKPMSRVAGEALPGRAYVALSGPSFAEEVSQGQPTAVVAASVHPDAAMAVQQLFASPAFRVYTSQDVVGTELAGSLKNVIAIAAGMLEGLGLGHNPRAAMITRGLAEITRLGLAMGADPRSFAGLAGVGDLILTTCGSLSRNRGLGLALGQGRTLAEYQRSHRTVIEGVDTARAAVRLAEREGVEMPITAKVAECLFEAKPVRQAIAELMERTLKPEQWT